MLPLLLTSLLIAAPPAPGLRAPQGFVVTEYADSTLANDITCMTIDPKGRIVVAGPGYIRVLLDEKDGRATRAVDVTRDVKQHAMGLLWEGDTLLAVVDNALRRFRIGPDGTTAAGPPEVVRQIKSSSDHHAHCLRRGPDGWLYLIAGDSTGIDSSYATTPTSPIREPVAGCLVRFSPDFKRSEIIADGFRNPYAFDFDPQGNVWTFDADNERCVSLPWYEHTRIYRVVMGGHHGWRGPQLSDTWRSPPYFVDVVPPVATCGRGSPTGVVYHKHSAWPASWRVLYVADWTFGKVWLLHDGSDKPEPFLTADGDHGFAPTALAVHPKTGDLFVSIGGRGTRGAVYRVRWTGGFPAGTARELAPKSDYGVDWKDEYLKLLPERVKEPYAAEDRVRALAELRRHATHFPSTALVDAVRLAWDSDDQVVRKQVANLIDMLPAESLPGLKSEAHTSGQRLTMALGLVRRDPKSAIELATNVMQAPATRLHAVRIVQMAFGDLTDRSHKATVWAGYTPRTPARGDPPTLKALRTAFPSGDAVLDRELSRTLAIIEDDDRATMAKVIGKLTAELDPLEDVHYLIVLSRLRGERKPGWTNTTAAALLRLDEKIITLKRNRDRNWPLRIAELHAELARKDPRLNATILNHPDFGRPDHALFARCAGFDRRRAAERFVERAKRDPRFEWDAELVGVLGELRAEAHRPLLRTLVNRGGLDDAILPILARAPTSEDLNLFLAGLSSPRLDIVRLSLTALSKLTPPNDGSAALALVRCLRLLPEGKEADRLRELVGARLESLSGETLGGSPQRWAEWLARTYPQLATKLGGADGVDVEGWTKRLAKIDWNAGDAGRGRDLFARASCAACHSGGQAMGPDLRGAAGRFSRNDLFTAMLQPSKEVSPRYRMTQIETTDGKTHQGLIVYEAVDGLILQTGPAQTVRLAGDKIESKRQTATSLMPTGLLDKLSDGEIADLYAFLKTMGK